VVGTVAVLVAAAPARAEPTGRLLATLDDGGTPRAMFAQTGVRPSGPRVPQIGLVTVRPAPGISAATALRRLRAHPRVRRACPRGASRFGTRPPTAR
jgi:hypothetical protein